MNDLTFNIYAFAAPSTKAEYAALLGEALRLSAELRAQIGEIDAILEEKQELVPA